MLRYRDTFLNVDPTKEDYVFIHRLRHTKQFTFVLLHNHYRNHFIKFHLY